MVHVLQILSILLAGIGMALSLAHALEYPGKRRLDHDTYVKVQAIYYPGFTIGGAGEPLALIAVFALLLFMPYGTAAFWLTLAAFVGLALAHAIYWAITHFRPTRSGCRASSSARRAPPFSPPAVPRRRVTGPCCVTVGSIRTSRAPCSPCSA
jgi:hypothetical protein